MGSLLTFIRRGLLPKRNNHQNKDTRNRRLKVLYLHLPGDAGPIGLDLARKGACPWYAWYARNVEYA